MSNVLLAGVKFNWRGAYANNVGYANNDAVGFNNSSFAAIAGVSAVPPMVPIASPTGTRFAVTVSGTTFRFAETRPDGALSSSSLITTSTANPTFLIFQMCRRLCLLHSALRQLVQQQVSQAR